MTEEETARFALVLRECERIRAMIAEDEAARSSGAAASSMEVTRACGGRCLTRAGALRVWPAPTRS